MSATEQSLTQHTPEPWTVVAADDGETYVCGGTPEIGNLPRPIFVLMRDDDEAHADATLAAAAPELVSVLIDVRDGASRAFTASPVFNRICEAIYKAIGQAVRP